MTQVPSIRGPLAWLRTRLPTRHTVRADLFAAVPCAMAGVPDRMAASVWSASAPCTAYTRLGGRSRAA